MASASSSPSASVILLLCVLIPFLGAAAIATVRRRPTLAWWIALASSGAALGAAALAARFGIRLELPWIPSWGASLVLQADPLGALLALLAAAIGTLVVLYSGAYVPQHLEEHARPPPEASRFYALMLLFFGSMLGLAFSRDLLLLFLFFDLTAVCSYALIGFDRDRPESRIGALTAVVTTGSASVLFLVAALLWGAGAGTFDVGVIATAAHSSGVREWAAALVIVAALAKSAQLPFHFWLPRAMAAPTPVSAYLHSAAMVAAGVFLLLRVEPLLEGTVAAAGLPWIGIATIVVGSMLALGADVLKELLAYSTVAQYGYIVLLIGLGSAAGAALYLAVHGIAKSALFLTAGAVTRTTGENRLSALRPGLLRRMPVTAGAAAVAAATLAGLPATLGYFKDEALFRAAAQTGPFFLLATAVGAILTFAYTARFWMGAFVGAAVPPGLEPQRDSRSAPVDVERPHEEPAEQAAEEPSRNRRSEPKRGDRAAPLLVAPVVLLAAVCLLGGFLPDATATIASAAGTAAAVTSSEVHLAYEPGLPLYVALAVYALGTSAYLLRGAWLPFVRSMHTRSRAYGPAAVYDRGIAALNGLSARLHALEVRDLRDRVAWILFPAVLLVVLALVAVARRTPWNVGVFAWGQVPLLPALAAVSVSALASTTRRTDLGLVLALSAVGYTLAGVYALLGAPELALVAALVETALTILLLAALGFLPQDAFRRGRDDEDDEPMETVQTPHHRTAGLVSGAGAFVVVWASMSVRDVGGVSAVHDAASGLVHAADPVSAILSDFRGFDTAGEITVLAAALLGLVLLARQRRST